MSIKISQLPERNYEDVADEGYIPVAIKDHETYKVPVKGLPFPDDEWEIKVTDKKLILWSK